jgi:N-acetylneuraminic acid mutarotase
MGPGSAGPVDLADALRYEPEQDRWVKLADLPGARRGAAAVALDDRYILIIGGCRNENAGPLMLDEVLAYDIQNDRYHVCDPVPYAAACQAAVMKDGQLYVIGGEHQPKARTDRVMIGKITRAEK